jgi:hypothetical protein
MKRQLVWMIATILAICGTMTQTSCFSYEDEPVLDPNPQAQTLEGVWYTAYEAEGTIPILTEREISAIPTSWRHTSSRRRALTCGTDTSSMRRMMNPLPTVFNTWRITY